MNISSLLTQRVSCPRVSAPGPDAEQLQFMLQAATSAPDHGQLRPWRFFVLEDEALAQLGDCFVAAHLDDMPELDEAAQQRIHAKALRAPTMIVVAADITPGHRVPEWEQLASSICAAEHMMLAAHAQGLGIMWRTGKMAENERVKRWFGLQEKDRIAAFLYVGTPAGALKQRYETPADYRRTVPS